MPDSALLLLAAAGFLASVLNVIAGGGSFLTLPILIFLGLPATDANATNRVGILTQNAGAVWGFHRHRVLDWAWALGVVVPGMFGAAVGAGLALLVGDRDFRRLLAFFMLAITLWTILDPTGRSARRAGALSSRPALLRAGFFLVGIYGGFVQAGVGFLALAVTTAAGLDLVRGNAVKVLTILVQTIVSLAIFAWGDKIQWLPGFALAAGSFLGSLVGVRLTVLKGHRWVQGVVTVTIVAFAVRLWLS